MRMTMPLIATTLINVCDASCPLAHKQTVADAWLSFKLLAKALAGLLVAL